MGPGAVARIVSKEVLPPHLFPAVDGRLTCAMVEAAQTATATVQISRSPQQMPSLRATAARRRIYARCLRARLLPLAHLPLLTLLLQPTRPRLPLPPPI